MITTLGEKRRRVANNDDDAMREKTPNSKYDDCEERQDEKTKDERSKTKGIR